MWTRFFVLVFATCLCRRSHVRCSNPYQWSIYCPDWLSSAPIKFCGIKKNDLMIAYSLFVQASCLSWPRSVFLAKYIAWFCFVFFCFPKYVCKWKGKSCLKGRITQALYQRKESWHYIETLPPCTALLWLLSFHSISWNFVIQWKTWAQSRFVDIVLLSAPITLFCYIVVVCKMPGLVDLETPMDLMSQQLCTKQKGLVNRSTQHTWSDKTANGKKKNQSLLSAMVFLEDDFFKYETAENVWHFRPLRLG